ncbi:hypothetical protein HFP05_03360 [Rhodanobacter denitrificans]|nr:hypothetical protein [Rhodanobacter denitrificans]
MIDPQARNEKKLLIGVKKPDLARRMPGATIDAMRDPSCGIAAIPRSMEPQNLSSPGPSRLRRLLSDFNGIV